VTGCSTRAMSADPFYQIASARFGAGSSAVSLTGPNEVCTTTDVIDHARHLEFVACRRAERRLQTAPTESCLSILGRDDVQKALCDAGRRG
jgi:hypothetical protein